MYYCSDQGRAKTERAMNEFASSYVMINVFENTPAEKEEYVMDMLQRGYGYKQIMKECHVSPNTISKVQKAMSGSTEDDGLIKAVQISKETQALKLFNEGKKPIDVAIELDIATDFVFIIYQNFQRLRNQEAFISSYEHVKGNIQPFLRLFDIMNGLGMTPEQVAQQVTHGNNLPYLGSIHSSISNDIWALASRKHFVESQLSNMENQLQQYKDSLVFYVEECQRKRNELLYLNSEINAKKNIIQNYDNDDGYVRIKEAAKKETNLLMQNNQVSCAVTLTATLEAIRRYPNNQMLISDIVTSRNYPSTSYQKPWMESHAPQLLQLMQNVQNEMADQLTGMVVRTMKSIPYESQK